MMTEYQGRFFHQIAVFSLGLITTIVIGCGDSDTIPRYDLSGGITYAGQPIAAGSLTLTPDSAKGNSGPTSGAVIKDGQYSTSDGKGIVGGAYLITVQGYDGVPVEIEGEGTDPNGKALFPPFEMSADLPKEGGTHDIEVPADAAK